MLGEAAQDRAAGGIDEAQSLAKREPCVFRQDLGSDCDHQLDMAEGVVLRSEIGCLTHAL